MLKGALFDLDGIIADTASYHFDAWKKLIKNHFDTDLPNQLEEKTKGVSREDSLSIILDYLGIQVSEENFKQLAAEKNEQYVQALDALTSQDILPGISDFIQELKEAKIRIALASASKNGPFILEKLGLLDIFDAIVDPSSVANGKPAPDIFLAAAQALELQPKDCIGIEDSIGHQQSRELFSSLWRQRAPACSFALSIDCRLESTDDPRTISLKTEKLV